jgi:hypothetical protein
MSILHPNRRRATWRQHFIAVARAFEAGAEPLKAGMRPGLKSAPMPNGPRGCAPSHS